MSSSQQQQQLLRQQAMSEATLSISGMSCSSCSSSVTAAVQSLPGVLRCSVDLIGECATVVYHHGRISLDSIVEAIEEVGFDASVLTNRRLDSTTTSNNAYNANKKDVVNGETLEINGGVGSNKSYSTFSTGNNNNDHNTPQEVIVEATFALEGLTCATCVNAVKSAVTSLGKSDETNNNSGSGLDVNSVDVRLLPDATLTVQYDTNLLNENDIVDAIEAVGFGATLTSKREMIQFQLDENSMEDGLGKRQRIKMLYISLSNDKDVVYKYLQQDCIGVMDVQYSKRTMTTTNEDGADNTSASNKLNYCQYMLHSIECIWNNISSKFTQRSPSSSSSDGYAQVATISRSEPTGGTLEVTYNEDITGVRTIVDNIESNTRTKCDEVWDALSYQVKQKSIDTRRQKEISQWRDQFYFAITFALPVFMISMVLSKVPSTTATYFDTITFCKISREEMWTWILATPVQFISGARFYRDSRHSIKSGKLGMSFLIAMGTSAAYLYSVSAVLYNAINLGSGRPRLMQSFESSSLLISFVLLGKVSI